MGDLIDSFIPCKTQNAPYVLSSGFKFLTSGAISSVEGFLNGPRVKVVFQPEFNIGKTRFQSNRLNNCDGKLCFPSTAIHPSFFDTPNPQLSKISFGDSGGAYTPISAILENGQLLTQPAYEFNSDGSLRTR